MVVVRLYQSDGRKNIVTAFLASVENRAEADVALRSGVDMLDLKETGTGALGALPVWRWRQVAPHYRHRMLVSATLGDPPYSLEWLHRRAALAAATGVHLIKLGLVADEVEKTYVEKLLSTLSRIHIGLVLVFLVDKKAPDLSRLSLSKRVSAVMLDTADKNKGRLTQRLSMDAIGRFVKTAKHYGFPVGLAGSLKEEDIPPLLSLQPDYLGFRGALCKGHERTNTLNPTSVRRIRSLLSKRAGYEELSGRACQQDVNTRHWMTESQLDSRRLLLAGGGKSGLRRARCQIISGRREPTESATENKPPAYGG